MHALTVPRQAIALVTALVAFGAAPPVPQPARAAGPAPADSARIALVPLDDRPISLQYPILLGQVADAAIVTPPAGILGRHLRAGDGEAIARWLDGLDPAAIGAAVISADMLAYGGLIGSRVPRVFEAEARQRLEAIGRLKQRRSDLLVFVIGTITRHAPTDDGGNAKWREALARWADIAGSGPGAADEAAALEKALPAGMLDRYRATRARNRAVNLALVELARSGAIDLLAFGRDDPSPRGLQAADAQAVADAGAKAAGAARVRVQPGVDDIGQLMIARAVAARVGRRPEVVAIYSSDAARDAATPDGRRLHEVVAAAVAAAGGQLTDRPGPAALRLFVHAPAPGAAPAAEAFAARVGQAVSAGARVAVADVSLAPPQGPSLGLVEGLRAQRLLPRLIGYGAAGDAATVIAGALAQGLVFSLTVDGLRPGTPDVARRVASAHLRLLLHRFIDDFLYHGVLRPQALDDLLAPRGMNPLRLDDPQRLRVEKYVLDELKPLAEGLVADFASSPWRLPPVSGRGGVALQVRDIENVEVTLPWARLSEAAIDFTLVASDAGAQPRPPRPRVIR